MKEKKKKENNIQGTWTNEKGAIYKSEYKGKKKISRKGKKKIEATVIDNFSKLMSDTKPQIQETQRQRILSRTYPMEITSKHITLKSYK